MTSAVLCYTDTSLGARIAYLIRITCPILIRYVSSEYPIFLFFANIGYGSRYVSVLRIRPSPITVDSLPSVPDALASDARTSARPRLAPHPRAVMPHPRSPAAGHLRRASARRRRGLLARTARCQEAATRCALTSGEIYEGEEGGRCGGSGGDV